jgi:ADP-heptose:LPS heptosyltransferase
VSAPTLVIYFARVGDLVMLTPFLRTLATQGPVELCARPWAAGLLANEPWLAAMHTVAKPNLAAWQDRLLGGARHHLGKSFAGRYARVVIFDREHKHVCRWIETWRGQAKLVVLPHAAQAKGLHLIDANRAAAEAVGVIVRDQAPRLTVPADALAAAQARLAGLGKRVIAIQAGSSLTHRWFRRQPNLKGLTAAQWARLLGRMLTAGEADAVILLGSAPEVREARAIRAAMSPGVRGQVHDWTGTVGLDGLPAVLAASSACISVDTGPAHIAAAVGTPLLAIFGPSDPGRFLPRGPAAVELLLGSAPCQYCLGTPAFRSCTANVCLTQLDATAIQAAWQRLFRRTQPPAV